MPPRPPSIVVRPTSEDRVEGSASSQDQTSYSSQNTRASLTRRSRRYTNPFVTSSFSRESSPDGASVERASSTGAGEDSASSNQQPFISEATMMNDIDALKEGLNFALGTSDNDPGWLPVSNNDTGVRRPSATLRDSDSIIPQDLTLDSGDYTENIPLTTIPKRNVPQKSLYDQDRTMETSSSQPFMEGTSSPYGNPFRTRPPLLRNPFGSLTVNTDLESGLRPDLLTPSIDKQQVAPVLPTPKKLTDVLARLSDRIAAKSEVANTPQTEHPPGGGDEMFPSTTPHLSINRPTLDKNASHGGSYISQSTKKSKDHIPKMTITDENDKVSFIENNPSELNTTTATEGLGLFLDNDHHEDSLKSTSSLVDRDAPVLHQIGRQIFRTKSNGGESNKPVNHPDYTPNSSKGNFQHLGTPNASFQTSQDTMYLFGNSLGFFSPQSKIRQKCSRILSHSSTNFTLLVLLIAQTLFLTYRQWNPNKLGGYVSKGNNFADYILMGINIIYTVEVCAKIIAYGLFDDRVMYEECGLPYPQNSLNWNSTKLVFNHLFKNIGLTKFHKVRRNQPPQDRNSVYMTPQNVVSELDVKEINLNDSRIQANPFDSTPVQFTELGKKYRISLHHEPSGKDSSPEGTPNPRPLNAQNTFVLSSPSKNIEQLHLKRAFLRSSWQRIDFISMVTFWISLALSINRYDVKHSIMVFRALSCLRILRLCNLTTGTSTILAACKLALPQLIDVSLFIFCFWIFFAIIGVQTFKSSLSRQCVWTNPDDPSDTWIHSSQYCGSWLDASGTVMPYLFSNGESSTVSKGFTCPVNSKCVSGENPFHGTVSFDNIFQSFEMVFVIISANTFTDIMYDTMDSENLAACLFFIGTIFIMTVWLLNVFIAVIVKSFEVTSLEQEREKSNSGHKRFHIFGPANRVVSLHTERIDFLKAQNIFLRTYYRLEFLFVILIAFDLFVQCFRSFSMNDVERHTLYRFECAFTIVFLVEIILRFIFYFPHWKMFFKSNRNMFDLFLAIITSVIILGPVKNKLGQAYYWLTVFQILRIYRVVLATSITRKLWLKIMGNFQAIFDLALFYFILLYLVSIIMARYYEGTIPEDEIDGIDFPMHTLPNSFIALYVITTTENWTDILYELQAYGHNTSSRVFGAMFLIGWFAISNSVLLNIFIAVIARTLAVSEQGKRKQQLLQFIDNMTTRLQSLDHENGLLSKLKKKVFNKGGMKDELEKAVVNLLLSGTAVNDFLDKDFVLNENNEEREGDGTDIRNIHASGWKRWFQLKYWHAKYLLKNPFYTKSEKDHVVSNFDPANFAKKIITDRNLLITKQNTFLRDNPNFNNVFYVMRPDHRIRRLCQKMVKSSYGERIDGVDPNKTFLEIFVIIMFIATMGLVITACYLTPLLRNSLAREHGTWNWSSYTEVAFTTLFTIEFIIKILADGIIFTPNAYMRSSWNLIDLVVLAALWIELISFLKNDGGLSRIVRGLKALRALRLLTISETAKNNFHNTMISGFGKIVNAAVISFCLLFPFSIWGLNIFNGRLGYCLDGSSDMASCYNEFDASVFNWNVVSPNVYTNPILHFDKFGDALVSLFEIISLEGWVDLLIDVMKSTGVGTPQQDFATPINGLFVMMFNFISTVFILTLFVSVIILNYSKTTGSAYMTNDQKSWYEVKLILQQVKPSKRKVQKDLWWGSRFCYRMTVEKNKYWNGLLSFLLMLHVIALVLETSPTPDAMTIFRTIVFIITSVAFAINVSMLLIGQGVKTFFHYKWNIFYLVVSYGATITTFIGLFVSDETVFVNINKLFLVGILAFIIPKSNRLSQLLRFASASLPTLISLSFTWIVVFLMFAIALNQIFGMTKIGPNTTDNINLRSVPKALILLFRCSFGEGWNFIMIDFTVVEPFCTVGANVDQGNDCGNKQYAYILFISWNIISMYIFVNMFISLILDSFSYFNNDSTYISLIQREEIRKFKRTWQKFDPEGTGFINPSELLKFLHTLDGALSFHLYSGTLEIRELCRKWFIRNNPGNPYDITVKYDAIEETFESMDIPKIRERRKVYDRFVEEALLTMELRGDPGISFRSVILQLPLYIAFEAGQCLNLIDFLERRLLLQKVEKRLHLKRVYDSINMYACRWKYTHGRMKGTEEANFLRASIYSEDINSNTFNYDSNELNKDSNEKSSGFRDISKEHTGSDDDFESAPEEYYGSNIYVPKSPVHLHKGDMRNRGVKDQLNIPMDKSIPSQLFIKIPAELLTLNNDHSISPSDLSQTMKDVEITVTESESPFIENSDHSHRNSSFIDISTIGETLQNTQWGEALRSVHSDQLSENGNDSKDYNKKL